MGGNKYLNELIRLKCGPDLLVHRLFPNAKEVTESFAAWHAVKHIKGLEYNDPNVLCVCVGDGHTPRTGATFAFRTAWTVASVDPMLRKTQYNIQRLTVHGCPIEDFHGMYCHKRVLIVAVHSHANLWRASRAFQALRMDIIAIPCCVPQRLKVAPTRSYRDPHILSEKNEILIWEDV